MPHKLSRSCRWWPAALVAALTAAGAVQDPVTTFSYDPSKPLDLTDSIVRTDSGIVVHAIGFASPKGGRATGLLFVPPGGGPFAGVLVGHGAPGNSQSASGLALRVALHGAVALALDAPWARRKEPPVTFTVQDSVDQVQLMVDLQRGVDLLIARRDVDPGRLGYVGRSYGGATGSLFAGIERRLKTYVIQVGDGGLVSHMTGPDDSAGPSSSMPRTRWNRWLAAIEPIEPIRFVGRAAPASLFFQSARQDELIPVADAEQLHKAGSEPKRVMWYESTHRLNAAAINDMLQWFHDKLGTRAPSQPDS
ncbi:MAG: prolyl oligopeptidase family serine peptidase [Gemmatimonadota bacterium]